MNDNHPLSELLYLPRFISQHVSRAIKESPVIVLTGARQVGKSTFLRRDGMFNSWKYLSFDDFSIISQAKSDPTSLWKDSDNLIIDEVQKVPEVLSAIKQTVDSDRHSKRFVLSGSANLLLMEKVTETLAGRSIYFQMNPMTLGEIHKIKKPDILRELFSNNDLKHKITTFNQKEILKLLHRGFMPPLLTLPDHESYLRWWESYTITYLERDLRNLSQIDSLADFKNMMQATALRSGQLINQTEIARDIKIGQATVFRYLNLLEASCLLKRVPAYSKSRTKRLIKSPKFYFIDPGLTAYLCGLYDMNSLINSREMGAIFESFVLLHLSVLCELMTPKAGIFYWRTASGKEVDFVIEHGNKLLGFEVKFSSSVSYNDIGGLKNFLEEYPQAARGIVLYTGNEVKHLSDKIIALPVSSLYS